MNEPADMTAVEISQPPPPQRKDRLFFVLWVTASITGFMIFASLAWPIGSYLGLPIGEWLTHFVVALFLIEISRADFNFFLSLVKYSLAGLLSGALAGVGIGTLQWLVLRLRMQGAYWWLVATFIGSCLSFMFSGFIGGFIVEVQPFGLFTLVCLVFIDAPMTGMILGIGQWLVLRRKLRNSILWLFVPWLYRVVIVILGLVGSWISLIFFGSDDIWNAGLLINWLYQIIFALFTGALLTWLMSKDSRYQKYTQLEE